MPPKTPPGGTPRPDRPPGPRNDHRDAFQRGTTVSSPEDQMARASALEEALEALRIHFEQYFLGLVRKPPTQERAAVRSAILQLKSSFVRNTAVKFRVNSLHNRYLSYERMWDRTVREMEDGTYRRDLFKARLHRARAGGGPATSATEALKRADAASPGEAPDDDFDVDEEATDAAGSGTGEAGPRAAPLPSPAAPARSAPVPPPTGVTGAVPPPAKGHPAQGGSALDDARIRQIHDAYVEARRRCQEKTDGITVEAVAAALRKQVPALLEKHGARSVDFQVVIQNGKAVLKAFPR